MSASPQLSILVPLFNEAESLPHLKAAIDEVLSREQLDAEILFVDDGSRDESGSIIDRFAREDTRVEAFHFRTNRGKSAALNHGFKHARGQFVLTMDADLQDDPNEIRHLLGKMEEGFDLVSGWKKKRYDPLSKIIPSRFFNFIARLASGIAIHDFNCGLKLYRREVVETIELYGELHRFIPVLAHSQGWRVGETVVQHHPRRWGKTKYGISRMLYGALDLLTVLFITRFSIRPMHLFGAFGLISLLAGFAILLYLSVQWFMGVPIGNRPLFFLGILAMILGVQFFSIGLLGELITNLRVRTQRQNSQDLSEPLKEA